MRKPVVGISLKIYMNRRKEAKQYIEQLKAVCTDISSADLFLFPSMGTISVASEILQNTPLHFGSQNIAAIENGALTGEFSVESLVDLNGSYVELGHAERRQNFNETDQMIQQKIKIAFANQLIPVVCIGESAAEKQTVKSHLKAQLAADFQGIPSTQLVQAIIAYEPIWAIGQKEAASSEYVHQAHGFIRAALTELYGEKVAQAIRIIYGGSVSKENAAALVNDENVDGVFVGRFGHDPANFKKIVEIISEIKGGR